MVLGLEVYNAKDWTAEPLRHPFISSFAVDELPADHTGREITEVKRQSWLQRYRVRD